MQLLVFGDCHDTRPLAAALEAAGVTGVLYEDVNDPRGIALLTVTQDPNEFVDRVRRLLNGDPFASLTQKPDFTMLGRTYAIGYEPDLDDALLHRPRRTVLTREWPWAIWYPLAPERQLREPARRGTARDPGGAWCDRHVVRRRPTSSTTSGSRVTASTRTTTTS